MPMPNMMQMAEIMAQAPIIMAQAKVVLESAKEVGTIGAEVKATADRVRNPQITEGASPMSLAKTVAPDLGAHWAACDALDVALKKFSDALAALPKLPDMS